MSWERAAASALLELARSGREFTAEDVRRRAPRPPDENAIGGLMRQAARAGLIACIRYERATRPQARGHLLRVWVGNA